MINSPIEFTPTEDGGAIARGVVSRAGVFEYLQADGTVMNELRSPEEIFAPDVIQSIVGRPVYIGEVRLSELPGKTPAGNACEFNLGIDELVATVHLSKEAIAQLDMSRNYRFSALYETVPVAEDGKYEGVDYQFRQTALKYVAIGIVPIETPKSVTETRTGQ